MSVLECNILQLDWKQAGDVVIADLYVLQQKNNINIGLKSYGGIGGLIMPVHAFTEEKFPVMGQDEEGQDIYAHVRHDAAMLKAFYVPQEVLLQLNGGVQILAAEIYLTNTDNDLTAVHENDGQMALPVGKQVVLPTYEVSGV